MTDDAKTADPEERTTVPAADVLGDLRVTPLPEGETPVGAFILIKTVDDEGDPSWSARTPEGSNLEEMLGSLTVQVELLRQSILQDYVDD